MIRKYKIEFTNGNVSYIDIKCEYSFGVTEGKMWIKEKHDNIKKITHIKNESKV